MNPKTNTIYVNDGNTAAVSVISGRANTATATIPVGHLDVGFNMGVNPALNTAYALTGSGVSVLACPGTTP